MKKNTITPGGLSVLMAGVALLFVCGWLLVPLLRSNVDTNEKIAVILKPPVETEIVEIGETPKKIQEVKPELFWELVSAMNGKGIIEVWVSGPRAFPRIAYYKRFGSEGEFVLMSQIDYKTAPSSDNISDVLSIFYSVVFIGHRIEKDKVVLNYGVEEHLGKGAFCGVFSGLFAALIVWLIFSPVFSLLFFVGGKLKKITLQTKEKGELR